MSSNDTVLVTGASGFVGQAIAGRLTRLGSPHRLVSRQDAGEIRGVGSMDAHTNWTPFLDRVATVVHAAARVHMMHDHAADPLASFRQTNFEGTMNLARQAARVGVRRFVFLSTIKVNGDHTTTGRPFTADDAPAPDGAYGLSKHEAEQALQTLARETGMAVVIIRPVLVYGPGVKGNFLSMMEWIARGVPLPLGAVHNRRSLVGIDNLVDLIVTCLQHPAAVNQRFLVSDGEDLSTTDLVRRLSRALGRSPRLIPVPTQLLNAAGWIAGKRMAVQRLLGSLQVDIEKTRRLLNWSPPVTVQHELAKTAAHFLGR